MISLDITIEPPADPPDVRPVASGGELDAIAWLAEYLRWERRLNQLRQADPDVVSGTRPQRLPAVRPGVSGAPGA